MEDTLGDVSEPRSFFYLRGLNPCFNGRYSRSFTEGERNVVFSLNPCFNGRYSRSYIKDLKSVEDFVLILVLMEDTLGVEKKSIIEQLVKKS